jgi:signal transduction histidine kinase
MQSYRPQGASYTVHEFTKPIFEGGRRAGIVRLGLKLPTVTIFSMERISLLAMIAFFILSALFVAYYGMRATLRTLKATYVRTLGPGCDGGLRSQVPPGSEKVMPILKELEESFTSTNRVLNEVREENMRLSSKLGVMGFEKSQLVNVLDSLNFGIIVVDLQNHVAFINEYMLNIINDKREYVVNKGLDRVFSQKEIVEHISGNETALSPQDVNSLETTFPDYAPKEVFHVSVSPLTAGERTMIGKMICVKNVTGTNMAKRAQEEFIAHVAHELGTSLTNIRAYSEMLMDGEVENAEMQKEFYNTINQETKRLGSIIQNLLNISKMEMGNLTLNKGLLRTDWLINDCLSTIEASAQSKQVTIETHVPDILPSFMADKELLKTAIINILGNAVKYTPEQGKITFSMEERDSAVVFDVEDTGYGMSEEDLSHVFEKFYRSGNPQVAGIAGTGLGLAIAHEIIYLHDGEIEVQSRLGEGSRFTIRIPKEEYSLGKS